MVVELRVKYCEKMFQDSFQMYKTFNEFEGTV